MAEEFADGTSQVISGVVASLGTSVSFATSAFVELEYVITTFEKYCDHSVAKHGLVSPYFQALSLNHVFIH